MFWFFMGKHVGMRKIDQNSHNMQKTNPLVYLLLKEKLQILAILPGAVKSRHTSRVLDFS